MPSKLNETLHAVVPMLNTTQRDTVKSFLQAPFTGTYTSQSAQIFGILKEMNETWAQKIEQSSSRFGYLGSINQEFSAVSDQLAKEIYLLDSSITRQVGKIAHHQKTLAILKRELQAEKNELNDMTNFLDNLVPLCKKKEESYNTRKTLRANEEAAVAEAISILSSDAVFETFSQSKSTQDTAYRVSSFLQTRQLGGSASVSIRTGRVEEAAKLLKEATRGSQSKRLPGVVSALQAGNPFTTVLSQINEMLVLIDEEEQADDKAYHQCKDDIRDLEKDQSETEKALHFKEMQVKETKSDSESTAKKIATTENLLQRERQKMIEMTATRTAENLDYQTDVKNLQDAEIILTKAVRVLKTYYDDLEAKIAKGQAGAAGLLQKSSQQPSNRLSNIDSAKQGTWDGSYTGQKSDGGDAVTMLQFILSETIKEEKLAHTTEEKAQVTYEDAMASSKLAEATAEQRLTGFQEDLAETQQDKLTYEEDVTGLGTELDRITTLLGKTKDECAFILDNFPLRHRNRETEVSMLKYAVRTIKKTPAYKEAENAKELKSFGACKEECQGNDEHAECKACLGGVTVSAYCVSHKRTPGCNRLKR